MLLKPLITEKSMRLAQAGQYTFMVSPKDTKTGLKAALESLFKVNVISVRMVKTAAKSRRSAKRGLKLSTSPKTKAIFTLKAGQTIEYFELPKKESKKSKSNLKSKN